MCRWRGQCSRLLVTALAAWLALAGGGTVAAADAAAPRPLHVKFYYDKLARVDGKPGVDYAVSVLSRFDLLVIGEPGESDADDQAVVARLLAGGKQVYGYLDLAEATRPGGMARLEAAMVRCAAAHYTGIFFDDAGWDFGVTRPSMNAAVAYSHGKGLRAMLNAWHPVDVLRNLPDPDFNPGGAPTALAAGDWILLESFYARSDDLYAGDPEGGFGRIMGRYLEAVWLAHRQGVQVAALTYHNRQRPLTDDSDRQKSLLLAAMLGLDGWAYSRSDDSVRVPWSSMPPLPAWHSFCSVVVPDGRTPGLWLRRTDAGILWFAALDSPPQRHAGFLPLATGGCGLPLTRVPWPPGFYFN